jgi:lysine 2,3-aminomutase
VERDDPEALTRLYEYYDPIATLPEEGQQWWRQQVPAQGYDGDAAAASRRRAAALVG